MVGTKQLPGQATKNINAKFIACDFWHGTVSQPMTRKLRFAELHIGGSIRYKYTLVGNYFLKCNKIKRIIISFNLFSYYNVFRKKIELHFLFSDVIDQYDQKRRFDDKLWS